MSTPLLRPFGTRYAEEPELSLLRSVEELKVKTAAHDSMWQLGSASWEVDLDAGTITFTNPRKWRITAPVQVIGTFYTKDSTWLWGWDHPSVPEPFAAHARLAKAFGEKYRLERYTTRKFVSSEAEAWHFAALACYLAGAQGAYRGPSGPTLVFMTFGEVKIEKA